VLKAFLGQYKETGREATSVSSTFPEFRELYEQVAGATFNEGLYRVHDPNSSETSTDLVKEAFPEVAKKVGPCFGYDWLGRQFGLDLSRRDPTGKYMVLMHEPGTSAVRGLPATVESFHDRILIEQAEAALAVAYFNEWASKTKRSFLPLSRKSCVGYKVPLFLNGKDELNNLEVSDLEVYWSICGQLRNQAMKGQPIRSIRIGD
jgi:hypothetical protein